MSNKYVNKIVISENLKLVNIPLDDFPLILDSYSLSRILNNINENINSTIINKKIVLPFYINFHDDYEYIYIYINTELTFKRDNIFDNEILVLESIKIVDTNEFYNQIVEKLIELQSKIKNEYKLKMNIMDIIIETVKQLKK